MIGGISMRKKQEIEQFCASQEVIRNYIDYVKLQGGNPAHHQARVLVNKCGKDICKLLEIGTRIETNESIIDICGDDEFCRDYHSRYTNTFQVFKSYAIGSIIIQETDDNFGNPVQIELSFYK